MVSVDDLASVGDPQTLRASDEFAPPSSQPPLYSPENSLERATYKSMLPKPGKY